MKLLKILTVVLFIGMTQVVVACSCMALGEISEEEINRTDLIVLAKAVKVIPQKESNNNAIGTFPMNKVEVKMRVIKGFKGASRKSIISVYTASDGAACGLNIQQGAKWMIYGNEYEGNFHASLCSRSRNVSKKSMRNAKYQEELQYLKKHL